MLHFKKKFLLLSSNFLSFTKERTFTKKENVFLAHSILNFSIKPFSKGLSCCPQTFFLFAKERTFTKKEKHSFLLLWIKPFLKV